MNTLLTKSNYLSYLQCPTKLWLEKNMPEKAKPVSLSQQYFIDEGKTVEQLAKSLFLNAVTIDRDASIAERLKQTEKAISDMNSVIFEASFLVDQLFAAIDILQYTANSWKIIEIKATNNIDKKHLQDIAFQFYVLQKIGIPIESANIMYLDKNTKWDKNASRLFLIKDVKEQIQPYLKDMDNIVTSAKETLGEEKLDNVHLCRKCFQDQGCAFKEYCWKDIKEPTVFDVPLHWRTRDRFTDNNILLLKDISENIEIKDAEREVINRGKHKTVDINKPAIAKELEELIFPIYFLDFETFAPAIPMFEGMKPYQRIPFQFSCHALEEEGKLNHFDFLHQENNDPRQDFLQTLINVLKQKGSIIVYHKYFEAGVLKELKEIADSKQREQLDGFIDRLYDLEKIFLNSYHHYAFKGSTSIKAVLPVLCPDLSYANLEIKKGDQASIAWLDIIQDINKIETIHALREYCKLDTYAMVAIYRKLLKLNT